jgi:hypothetical protein
MATDQERMSYYLLPAKNPGGGSVHNPGATGGTNIYVLPAQKPPAPRNPAEASRRGRARGQS